MYMSCRWGGERRDLSSVNKHSRKHTSTKSTLCKMTMYLTVYLSGGSKSGVRKCCSNLKQTSFLALLFSFILSFFCFLSPSFLHFSFHAVFLPAIWRFYSHSKSSILMLTPFLEIEHGLRSS